MKNPRRSAVLPNGGTFGRRVAQVSERPGRFSFRIHMSLVSCVSQTLSTTLAEVRAQGEASGRGEQSQVLWAVLLWVVPLSHPPSVRCCFLLRCCSLILLGGAASAPPSTVDVKICERVDPGILTAVEFLHRRVAWNAEEFSWAYDPKHTMTMAEAFGFDGKKQLEQVKWHICGTGIKERWATRQVRDTALPCDGRSSAVCGAGQTGSTTCYEGISEIHVASHRCREVHAQTIVQVLQRPCSAGHSLTRKCRTRSDHVRELGR